jgi:hypothetical protein
MQIFVPAPHVFLVNSLKASRQAFRIHDGRGGHSYVFRQSGRVHVFWHPRKHRMGRIGSSSRGGGGNGGGSVNVVGLLNRRSEMRSFRG